MISIDFFCGGGGLTKGLTNAGITVLGGYDNCPDYRDTYEQNNGCKFICRDIKDIDKNQVYLDFPEIKDQEDHLLLSGCAPCQPFSSQRRSAHEHTDKNLLTEFGRLVIAIRPAYILVENVPGLKGRGEAVFKKFIDQLSINGYMFAYRVVNAKDYGVPQNRKRLVIVASRLFQPIIPEGLYGKDKLPYRTVRDAIAHYPPIEAGGVDNTFYNHSSSTLSPLNMARIEATPHSGGDRRAWPGNLVLACHNDHDGHTDVYGRMFWDQVSPALTARCYSLSNGRYGHPEQNRAISLREAAALQSFPDDYIFYGNTMSVGRQIGNAVPVKLAEELARYIVHMSRNAQLEMY